MYNAQPNRQLRAAIVEWVSNDNYTHAITLNTDRELTLARLRSICSTFCHRFDKNLHQVRKVQRIPAGLRLEGIFFPENLATNAHLHGLVNFTPALDLLGNEWRLKEFVRCNWLQSTHGAGSIDLKPEPDEGWARYSTKKFNGTYFLAADFRPT